MRAGRATLTADGATHDAMTMIQALRSAMDVMLERDPDVVVYGQDVGYFGGVFRVHRGPAGQVRHDARVRRADLRGRHRRLGDRHGRLRPAAGGRDPVRRLLLSGVRPDRLGGGAPALPLGRRLHRADHDPHAVRRRHLRRADPQPEPGGAVHPRLRHPHRDAEQPVRRQGPADRVDRERRPGHLPRAQAALQRPVRRPSRPAGDAAGPSTRSPTCPRATTPCRSNRRRCSGRAATSPC